ncbi:MAG: YHYH protein [Bacteroidota bacterium]|nr:YHYH protein [Bacteroidota bacterium]
MRKLIHVLLWQIFILHSIQAQVGPSVKSWLQNTSQKGSYYMNGNSTAISNNILVNCQEVSYSSNYVYIKTQGIPAYPTGPFNDGNPSQASSQNSLFRFPINPRVNTGLKTATTGGNIGAFINGVALFDYRDGVAWNTATNALCGGPGNPACPGGPTAVQSWNRDAVVAERIGFDCSKGHPAMGNYHHHQNPTAFKTDNLVISTICNLYDADGLYIIDSTSHSPLIGFAYDGFPIYGAYGYKNADGTGGITRIKSAYQLRNITNRTEHAGGINVPDGPVISATYPLGYFREDYEWVSHVGEEDFLDIHNGRFCVTPEYPLGTYAYFATVDANHNSAYPYVVGPTFYGVYANAKVASISEAVTVYTPPLSGQNVLDAGPLNISVFPNPSSELIVIQIGNLVQTDMHISLIDMQGKLIATKQIIKGSTLAFFDTQTLYAGTYYVRINAENNANSIKSIPITIVK